MDTTKFIKTVFKNKSYITLSGGGYFKEINDGKVVIYNESVFGGVVSVKHKEFIRLYTKEHA